MFRRPIRSLKRPIVTGAALLSALETPLSTAPSLPQTLAAHLFTSSSGKVALIFRSKHKQVTHERAIEYHRTHGKLHPLLCATAGERDNRYTFHLNDLNSLTQFLDLSSEDRSPLFIHVDGTKTSHRATVRKHAINATLEGCWKKEGLELQLQFSCAKTGSAIPIQSWYTFGEQHRWILFNEELGYLAKGCAPLLRLFDGGTKALIAHQDVAPVLERLDEKSLKEITFTNLTRTPRGTVVTPKPTLTISVETSWGDNELNHHNIIARCTLGFAYPPSSSKEVFCRDHRFERAQVAAFERAVGQEMAGERKISFSRTEALNFLYICKTNLADAWEISSSRPLPTLHTPQLIVQMNSVSGADKVTLSPKLDLEGRLLPLDYLYKDTDLSNRNDDAWCTIPRGKGVVFHKIPCGNVRALRKVLHEIGFSREETYAFKVTPIEIPWAQAINLLRNKNPHFKVVRGDLNDNHAQWIGKFVSKRKPPTPSGFVGTLRPYQLDGLKWMQLLSQNNLGGLLSDEMGTGKTAQTLAYLLWKKQCRLVSGEHSPALVSATSSTTAHWVDEARKFTPGLRIALYDGSSAATLPALRAENDIIVVSHFALRRDIASLSASPWSDFILDEASFIRNRKTGLAISAKLINASTRLALSGTPIENSLEDLWSIADFIVPGLLGTFEEFSQCIKGLNGKSRELTDAARRYIADRTSILVLRREKVDVLPELLPIRYDERVVPMTVDQERLYKLYREQWLSDIQHCGQISRENILAVITRLRQIANHPLTLPLEIDPRPSLEASGKWIELLGIIDRYNAQGKKLAIFCQFEPMLRLIEAALLSRKVPTFTLTGSIPSGAPRRKLIAGFNDYKPYPHSGCVFLSNIKAGGYGINLPTADGVAIYDPWWNPAVELQAADRGHRLGREGELVVHRLFTAGTVEEKIRGVSAEKLSLFRDVMRGALKTISNVSTADLLKLI